MRNIAAIIFIAAAAASAQIVSRPVTPVANGMARPRSATTQPLPPSRPLPDEFKVLLTRSIFSNGHTAVAAATTQPTGPAALTLSGIAQENSRFTAFLVDPTGNTVAVRVGDVLAGGRVMNITLHTLDFELSGERRRLLIGQNLAGAWAIAGEPEPVLAGGLLTTPDEPAARNRPRARPEGELSSGRQP